MTVDPRSTSDLLDQSLQRIQAAADDAARTAPARKAARAKVLDDARHIEAGLVSLIRKALDQGKLDADDAAVMLPLVRKVIEGGGA